MTHNTNFLQNKLYPAFRAVQEQAFSVVFGAVLGGTLVYLLTH